MLSSWGKPCDDVDADADADADDDDDNDDADDDDNADDDGDDETGYPLFRLQTSLYYVVDGR